MRDLTMKEGHSAEVSDEEAATHESWRGLN